MRVHPRIVRRMVAFFSHFIINAQAPSWNIMKAPAPQPSPCTLLPGDNGWVYFPSLHIWPTVKMFMHHAQQTQPGQQRHMYNKETSGIFGWRAKFSSPLGASVPICFYIMHESEFYGLSEQTLLDILYIQLMLSCPPSTAGCFWEGGGRERDQYWNS